MVTASRKTYGDFEMRKLTRLRAGVAAIVCVAVFSVQALAEVVVYSVRLPNVSAGGALTYDEGPVVDLVAKVNLKNGSVKAKAAGTVQNASGQKVSFKALSGALFETDAPSPGDFVVTYSVKANGAAKLSAGN